jgi:hypothetical protein
MPRQAHDTPTQFAPAAEIGPTLFDEPAQREPAVVAGATGLPAPREPWAQLAIPFPPEVVELKPGAMAEEKKRVLALAYVDARHYQARLDAVVGVGGWSVTYRPWGERAVICTLTIQGVTREDVGEAEKGDPDHATSAAMQAFKRACAAFGLGRYLYTELPQIWADAEPRGRTWAIKDAPAVVATM